MNTAVDETRFWAKVVRGSEVECWPWLGEHYPNGYARAWVQGSKKRGRAHRISYELLVGPITDGLVIDHLCRNRGCVNPAHMEPVSSRRNTLRGIGPAAINSRREKCVNGHEFTPENTRHWTDKKGKPHRGCKECRRITATSDWECPTCGMTTARQNRSRHNGRHHARADALRAATEADQ